MFYTHHNIQRYLQKTKTLNNSIAHTCVRSPGNLIHYNEQKYCVRKELSYEIFHWEQQCRKVSLKILILADAELFEN